MTSTNEQKAVAACVELTSLLQRQEALSIQISNSLSCCPRHLQYILGNADYSSHLDESIKIGETNYQHQPSPIVSGCEWCKKAQALVLERKVVKTLIGATKRTLRSIGKANAIDVAGPPDLGPDDFFVVVLRWDLKTVLFWKANDWGYDHSLSRAGLYKKKQIINGYHNNGINSAAIPAQTIMAYARPASFAGESPDYGMVVPIKFLSAIRHARLSEKGQQ